MIWRGAIAAACAFALAGCATVHAAETAPALKVAVVGDSITAVLSEDFAAGKIDATSWVNQLGDRYDLIGGWAVPGAHTRDMLANVQPLHPDVLIVLAGTNDLFFGDPIEETQANLIAIADKVDADRVVLSAIPPLNPKPGLSDERNKQMRAFAKDQGWAWIDPTAPIRDGEVYAAGLSDDGLHPNAVGEERMGDAMRTALDRITAAS